MLCCLWRLRKGCTWRVWLLRAVGFCCLCAVCWEPRSCLREGHTFLRLAGAWCSSPRIAHTLTCSFGLFEFSVRTGLSSFETRFVGRLSCALSQGRWEECQGFCSLHVSSYEKHQVKCVWSNESLGWEVPSRLVVLAVDVSCGHLVCLHWRLHGRGSPYLSSREPTLSEPPAMYK